MKIFDERLFSAKNRALLDARAKNLISSERYNERVLKTHEEFFGSSDGRLLDLLVFIGCSVFRWVIQSIRNQFKKV